MTTEQVCSKLKSGPLDDGSYPLTSTSFKLEIALEDASPEVKRFLMEFARRRLGTRRRVVNVALMVKYRCAAKDLT